MWVWILRLLRGIMSLPLNPVLSPVGTLRTLAGTECYDDGDKFTLSGVTRILWSLPSFWLFPGSPYPDSFSYVLLNKSHRKVCGPYVVNRLDILGEVYTRLIVKYEH